MPITPFGDNVPINEAPVPLSRDASDHLSDVFLRNALWPEGMLVSVGDATYPNYTRGAVRLRIARADLARAASGPRYFMWSFALRMRRDLSRVMWAEDASVVDPNKPEAVRFGADAGLFHRARARGDLGPSVPTFVSARHAEELYVRSKTTPLERLRPWLYEEHILGDRVLQTSPKNIAVRLGGPYLASVEQEEGSEALWCSLSYGVDFHLLKPEMAFATDLSTVLGSFF